MTIKIVENNIALDEVKKLAEEFYVTMIKVVVDIERKVIASGGEYHIDANMILIKNGSKQSDIWGFNVYFEKSKEEWI